MANYLENLTTARDQIAANLAEMTAQPKPTYSIDGQAVSWQSLFDSYVTQLDLLNALIANADPIEFQTRGVS